MARRVARAGLPLEWKTDFVTTNDATVTRGEFDLDLLPDEIAEIYGIQSIITVDADEDANDDIVARKMLSMDPDADDDPTLNSNLEDLEVFYIHDGKWKVAFAEATETGGYALQMTSKDEMWLPEKYPILVGTNFAQVVKGDANEVCEFITTVYFKRKKATAKDLNQILLKRR